MNRILLITIFSISVIFSQEGENRNKDIKEIRKQAVVHAMKDFYPKGFLGWGMASGLPIWASRQILLSDNYWDNEGKNNKKIDALGYVFLTVPFIAMIKEVNIPEDRENFINSLSEHNKLEYANYYRRTIKLSRAFYIFGPLIIMWQYPIDLTPPMERMWD